MWERIARLLDRTLPFPDMDTDPHSCRKTGEEWAPRKKEDRVTIPIWLKETLALDVKQTKETHEIGKKSCPTGPSYVKEVQGKEALSPSFPPHMRTLARANHETFISPDVTNGRVRGLSEASTLSGSVLKSATNSPAVTDCPQPANYSRSGEHVVSPNHVKAFYTSKDKSNMPINSVADDIRASKFVNDKEDLDRNQSNNNKDKGDSSALPTSLSTPTQVAPAINPGRRASMPSTQDQTINQGRLFAQLAGNKYGSAKYMASRVKAKANTALQPSVMNEDKEAMDQTASIPIETLGITAPVGNDRNKASGLPSKSSEENASISAPSNPKAPSNMFNSALDSCIESPVDQSQEENREHTTFFRSWGPQLTRDTPGECHHYYNQIYSWF